MMHESEDASLKYAQLVDSATTEFRQETPSLSKAYNKRSKQERRLLNRPHDKLVDPLFYDIFYDVLFMGCLAKWGENLYGQTVATAAVAASSFSAAAYLLPLAYFFPLFFVWVHTQSYLNRWGWGQLEAKLRIAGPSSRSARSRSSSVSSVSSVSSFSSASASAAPAAANHLAINGGSGGSSRSGGGAGAHGPVRRRPLYVFDRCWLLLSLAALTALYAAILPAAPPHDTLPAQPHLAIALAAVRCLLAAAHFRVAHAFKGGSDRLVRSESLYCAAVNCLITLFLLLVGTVGEASETAQDSEVHKAGLALLWAAVSLLDVTAYFLPVCVPAKQGLKLLPLELGPAKQRLGFLVAISLGVMVINSANNTFDPSAPARPRAEILKSAGACGLVSAIAFAFKILYFDVSRAHLAWFKICRFGISTRAIVKGSAVEMLHGPLLCCFMTLCACLGPVIAQGQFHTAARWLFGAALCTALLLLTLISALIPHTPPGFGKNLHAVHLRRLERGRMLCMAVTALLVLCCGIPDEFRVSSHYLLLAVVALMLSSTAFQCGLVARMDVVQASLRRAIALEAVWAPQGCQGGRNNAHPGRLAQAQTLGLGSGEGSRGGQLAALGHVVSHIPGLYGSFEVSNEHDVDSEAADYADIFSPTALRAAGTGSSQTSAEPAHAPSQSRSWQERQSMDDEFAVN